jgi:adenine deaminase
MILTTSLLLGVTDDDLCRAVNLLIKHKGGLSVVDGPEELELPLPIAGLMSDKSCKEMDVLYTRLSQRAKAMGCQLKAPFMTLSFMALLVIPSLKLSDKGLFDGNRFGFTDLFYDG